MGHRHQFGNPVDLAAHHPSGRLQVKAAVAYLTFKVGQLHLQLNAAISELTLILGPLRQPRKLTFITPPAPFRWWATVVWIVQAVTFFNLPLV
jgi:hypothetical protein